LAYPVAEPAKGEKGIDENYGKGFTTGYLY